MEKPQVDAWPRRGFGLVAGGLLAALAGIAPTGGAGARKKRRRKRKNRRRSPSACARVCGSACSFCFHRAGGSLLCGDGAGVSCDQPCTADDECSPGSPTRFCLVSGEDPATGTLTPLCPGPGGHCAQVNVCEA